MKCQGWGRERESKEMQTAFIAFGATGLHSLSCSFNPKLVVNLSSIRLSERSLQICHLDVQAPIDMPFDKAYNDMLK